MRPVRSVTHNAAGNLATEARTFTGITGTFTTSYGYDAEGKLLSVTYPSGRVVAATYASGGSLATGRLNTLTDSTTSSTLLGSISDNAAGQIISRTFGGGTLTETHCFNSRSQLTGTTATIGGTPILALGFGYGDSSNGKIRSRIDSLQPEHSVDYGYDEVQRLKEVSAVTPEWSINWEYDVYGNRTSQTRSGLATSLVAEQSPTFTGNRNNALSGDYDDAGNILTDGSHPLAYDGESRLKSVSSGGITYVYDGDGRRVKRIVSGGDTTYYLYGLTGLLSEFSTSSTDNNATAAASTDRLKYRVAEQTGTGVLMVNADGTVVDNNRVLPFGELWSSADSKNAEKFTTYQRDSAIGLDYAMARDYAEIYGRFMSPDPGHIGADPGDPQTLNAYVYATNDSVNGVDPSGLQKDCFKNDKPVQCPIPDPSFDCTINPFACPSTPDVPQVSEPARLAQRIPAQRTTPCAGMAVVIAAPTVALAPETFGGSVAAGIGLGAILGIGAAEFRNCMASMGNSGGGGSSKSKITRWGWPRTQRWNKVLKLIREGGDKLTLDGIVPTREEAIQFLENARIDMSTVRVDAAHPIGGVSTHIYDHINYYTNSGLKATIRIIAP